MPQLGESVTEGTVTRWLKKEGDFVKVDEPLLEVSTDKVDTEIPSPTSGVLRGITVGEEETVEVGAELAVIDELGADSGAPAPAGPAADQFPRPVSSEPPATPPLSWPAAAAPPAAEQPAEYTVEPTAEHAAAEPPGPVANGADYLGTARPDPVSADSWRSETVIADTMTPDTMTPDTMSRDTASPDRASMETVIANIVGPDTVRPATGDGAPGRDDTATADAASQAPAWEAPSQAAPDEPPGMPWQPDSDDFPIAPLPPAALPGSGTDGPYITPLVRKLAAEHGVDLSSIDGTGVGGRIRKQDVVEAAAAARAAQAAQAAAAAAAPPAAAVVAGPAEPAAQPGATAAATAEPGQQAVPATSQRIEASPLRGTTERMSRLRQLIAQRMVDSLQTSAQLTTVVEADVTKIAWLRQRAKADFEVREGVRLTFLPFFALAALEALKIHPRLNAVIDAEHGEVTYHDVEHLGVAVDTERGLLVPVIRNAGDLNIGGLARKIGDLASRTRSGQVSPDELSGGTFTLTNTGSRGALFDTPIINQPQVAILGTGAVVKRPVVLEDPGLGEVIAVRSMVYLALTYDHRLVDGADAARFLGTVKGRLEEGAFEAELGL
jgi:2-oxoglutarate dehydrogenase E2 component (dihydrolipoamide succinyltransferase)